MSALVAGGIGVTPILCMAERLANTGGDFEMHYCTRTPERTAFRQRIADSGLASRVQFHFDDGDAAQKLDLNTVLAKPTDGVHLYVCGPKGFMDAVLATAREKGWPQAQLHYEFFAGETVATEDDGSFEVQLASSGKVVVVSAGKTVVAALQDAGVDLPVSCEQGVCGTCLTRVIDGVPDHRDLSLTRRSRVGSSTIPLRAGGTPPAPPRCSHARNWRGRSRWRRGHDLPTPSRSSRPRSSPPHPRSWQASTLSSNR